MDRQSFSAVALLAVLALILYTIDSGHAPVYLHPAEVLFALQAHAIGTTAHDTNGRLLPLYFQMNPIGENVWFHPVIVYFMAPFLRLLPLSEAAVRFPTAVVGVIDVVLMFFVARRLFGQRWALLAAALLALTPTHFMHSRIAMDYIYPVPFVLAWIWCLLVFLERRQLGVLFAATSILGFGFYSYIASVIMMPVYLALTWMAIYMTRQSSPWREYRIALAGFVWPLSLVVLWVALHPAVVAETLSRYQVGAVVARSRTIGRLPLGETLEELRQPLRFSAITGRVSLYWYFFDPSFLFVTGSYANIVNSTRRVGIFLLPFLVFLPVGLAHVASLPRTRINLLLLLGFLTAPLAACLVVPEPYAIDRELELVPFAILIGVCGVRVMFEARQRLWRMAALCLLAVVPLHFAFLCFDYWRDYPMRAAYWFEGNHQAALENIISRDGQDRLTAVYFPTDRLPYIDAYWRLYLLKHRREDLLARTTYVDSKDLDVRKMPARSLLLSRTDAPEIKALVQSGQLRPLDEFPEVGNPPLYLLVQRP